MIASSSSNPDPGVYTDSSRDLQARAYESAHARAMMIRFGLTLLLLSVYHFSGASVHLVSGLRLRFEDSAWAVDAVYMGVSLFMYLALVFPLSLYTGHMLEHRYERTRLSLGDWMAQHIKTLIVEVLVLTLLFSVIFTLIRWAPLTWWIWSAGFYTALSLLLSEGVPLVLLLFFHRFDPIKESEDIQALRDYMQGQGFSVEKISSMTFPEEDNAFDILVTGLGPQRRILLSEEALNRFSQKELIALLAHEVGHVKHRDLLRIGWVESGFAVAAFFGVHLAEQAMTEHWGFAGFRDIASMPVLLICLLLVFLLIFPLINTYTRRRELAADAFAVRSTGSAGPLVGALEKLAVTQFADRNPSRWTELLLHNHPAIVRRIRYARRLETQL